MALWRKRRFLPANALLIRPDKPALPPSKALPRKCSGSIREMFLGFKGRRKVFIASMWSVMGEVWVQRCSLLPVSGVWRTDCGACRDSAEGHQRLDTAAVPPNAGKWTANCDCQGMPEMVTAA